MPSSTSYISRRVLLTPSMLFVRTSSSIRQRFVNCSMAFPGSCAHSRETVLSMRWMPSIFLLDIRRDYEKKPCCRLCQSAACAYSRRYSAQDISFHSHLGKNNIFFQAFLYSISKTYPQNSTNYCIFSSRNPKFPSRIWNYILNNSLLAPKKQANLALKRKMPVGYSPTGVRYICLISPVSLLSYNTCSRFSYTQARTARRKRRSLSPSSRRGSSCCRTRTCTVSCV